MRPTAGGVANCGGDGAGCNPIGESYDIGGQAAPGGIRRPRNSRCRPRIHNHVEGGRVQDIISTCGRPLSWGPSLDASPQQLGRPVVVLMCPAARVTSVSLRVEPRNNCRPLMKAHNDVEADGTSEKRRDLVIRLNLWGQGLETAVYKYPDVLDMLRVALQHSLLNQT